MFWIILIVLFFVAIPIWAAISMSLDEKRALEEMRQVIDSRIDFTDSKVVVDNERFYYFAVDDERQEVFCYSLKKTARFKYSDIVSVEILQDNVSVVSKKSGSLGGAIVGGIVGGGVGAVVGGTSMGTTTSSESVNNLDVHILIRNSDIASFSIKCLGEHGAGKSNPIYTQGRENAQVIFDILRLAMDKVQIEKNKLVAAETPAPKSNIEELKELAELKQQGIITDEEFATLKAKILSK